MNASHTSSPSIIAIDSATGILPVPNRKPITVIGNNSIRAGFDSKCLQQAINSRLAPGVTDLVLNPDAHAGYGAPVGCVMISPTHIYPGPVGVDIKCSMSLLQLDLPADQINDRRVRRALIDAIGQRIPTGAGRGQRNAPKSRHVGADTAYMAAVEGASPTVLHALGIPHEWATRCEDSAHLGHDGTTDALANRLDRLLRDNLLGDFAEKASQLGSYGAGNHFGECEVVDLCPLGTTEAGGPAAGPSLTPTPSIADVFGLKHDHVAFLSHCGSRGLGHKLASGQFRALNRMFDTWSIPLPAEDKELVYAPLGTPEANAYLDDMALGANFATLNHLLINALVLDAFREVFPGMTGRLVYFISHNIARREIVGNQPAWVHRKGATCAFPAHHHELRETPFYETGHPILLPGNPRDGSVVMVAQNGAEKSRFSVNHGAGRCMGRREACRQLDQAKIDEELNVNDILSNCRQYPKDEAPDAYKDFNAVLTSVEDAGLARTVAKLKARFVIKDGGTSDD